MSIKRNIVAGIATQIYVTLISFLILPLYLKYMGAETYGLVGFFTMLQVWFNLLDVGLTPTITRETSRFQGGVTDVLSYRRLIRALQMIFGTIGLSGGGLLMMSSGVIASQWLNVQTLQFEQVQFAIQLMAGVIAMRWMSGLYRGCIAGFEKLVWLGSFNAFIATLRSAGALPVMIWIGPSATVFFTYQILVGMVEIIGLASKSHRLLPVVCPGQKLGWRPYGLFTPLKPVLKFSLVIAFTSSVWVFVTQIDKLVLSKLLTLSDYGYFTLAVLAASGVMLISGPVSNALMPQMTRLQAEGDERGLIKLYRNATQMVAVITIPLCIVVSVFAEQILWAWTGDMHASLQAAPVLRLYALGNGFLTIGAFPYYLQFAKGDLKLHLVGSMIFLCLLVPLLTWATWTYGAIGAGYAWLSANAIYFIAWIPLVHRRLVKGLHKQWLLFDVGQIAIPGILITGAISKATTLPDSRLEVVLYVGLICLVSISLLFAFTNNLRGKIISFIKYRIARIAA